MKFSKFFTTRPQLLLVVALNRIANRFGYGFQKSGLGYYSANEMVKKARQQGKTMCEYLESSVGTGEGHPGRRDNVIALLNKFLAGRIDKPKILEIGAGTGIFLEKFVELYKPVVYESYETDRGWAAYLGDEYHRKVNLIAHTPNGFDLHQTASASVDLVVAHGVFVYLPLIQSFGYLREMVRVCSKKGYVVFDFFLIENLTVDVANDFLQKKKFFPVFAHRRLITDFASQCGLSLVGEFDASYHESVSTYFVFQSQ